jgi:hypothetical protein
MSSKKVNRAFRTLSIVSATYANNVTTITTKEAAHYLVNNDLITVMFTNVPQVLDDVAVAVTGANTFTIPTTMDLKLDASATIQVYFFSAGMTGLQRAFTISQTTALPAIIQSYVSGTGTAVYDIVGTLFDPILGIWEGDGSSVTHTAIDKNSQATTIGISWAWLNINITSIGTLTKLYINYCG